MHNIMTTLLAQLQGVTAPVDPTINPTGFLTQLLSFVHTSWAIALMLGAYGVLEVACLLGKDVPALKWLDQGRITLAIAGGISIIGAALNVLLSGGQWQAAFIAAAAAVFAFWHPAAPQTSRVANTQSGSVSLSTMIVLAMVTVLSLIFALPSCAWFGGEAKKAETALIDCTKGDLAGLEQIAVGIAPAVFGGQVAWDDVEKSAVFAGEKIGGCFIADVAGDVHLIALKTTGSATGPQPRDARLAYLLDALTLEHFRSQLKVTAKYHTASGDR